MPLPTFNFNITVTPETGRIDKIHATIGSWIIRNGSMGPFLSIGENGIQPLPENDGDVPSREEWLREQVCALKYHLGSTAHGWIFNAPKDQLKPWSLQKVRDHFLEILPDGNEPLFSGQLESKPYATEYRLCGKLWLNPTRYAQAVCARHAVGAPIDAAARVREFPRPVVFGGEASLDQEDNWIPDVPGYHHQLEPAPFRQNLITMLRDIDEALNSEMLRAAHSAGVALVREPQFDLHEVEVYWEFSCPEPLAVYEALKPVLRSFGQRLLQREYVNSNHMASTDEILANCPCWTFPRTGAGGLKIYAKTNRRIRIEVSFHVADIPGVSVSNGSRIGGIGQIDILRQKAATRVNELLAHLAGCHPNGTVIPTTGDPMRHFMEFVAIVRSTLETHPQPGMSAEQMAYDILTILRQNKALRAPRGSHFHETVRRLYRKRPAFLVFRGRGGSGTYAIAPEFRSHFEKLFVSLLPQFLPITIPASTPPPPFQTSLPESFLTASPERPAPGASHDPPDPTGAQLDALPALPVARPREPASPLSSPLPPTAGNLPVANTRW